MIPQSGIYSPFVHFYINERIQGVPIRWWEKLQGPCPDPGYRCDGCTSVPDHRGNLEWWPACVIHDWHYDGNGPDIDRWEADWIFRLNLRRLLKMQGAKSRWVYTLPTLYWAGVRLKGRSHYKRSLF